MLTDPSPTNLFNADLQNTVDLPDNFTVTASVNNGGGLITAPVSGTITFSSASAESVEDGKLRDYYLLVADLTLQPPDPSTLIDSGQPDPNEGEGGYVKSWSVSITPIDYYAPIAEQLGGILPTNWQPVCDTDCPANQPTTTPESTSYTNGMSQTLGASCGFFGDQGTLSVSGSLTVEHSKTVTVGDVEVLLDKPAQVPTWTFQVHNNSATHAITPEVQALFARLDDNISPAARSGDPKAFLTAPVAVFAVTIGLQWTSPFIWEIDEIALSGTNTFCVAVRVPPVPAATEAKVN
jgi:hypothetical protein